MTITIEKNNRNSVCAYCKKKISGNKRVKFNYNAYCHLKCRYGVINKWLLEWKPELKLLKKHKKYMLLEWKPELKLLKKHKKYMLLEGLE